MPIQPTPSSNGDLPEPARKNVATVAQLEQQLHGDSTWAERAGSTIAKLFGSLGFVLVHLVVVALWIAFNTGLLPGFTPFDPFPFALLALVIGVEFLILTTFVLINQNTQARRMESWIHLSLQIALLAEQESTKSMEMLRKLCKRLGIESIHDEQDVKELIQSTSVESLAKEIEEARK